LLGFGQLFREEAIFNECIPVVISHLAPSLACKADPDEKLFEGF
jgi:hypothetical protein